MIDDVINSKLFFQKITVNAIFSAAMTSGVELKNHLEGPKVYCHCFCVRWTPTDVFEQFLPLLFFFVNKGHFCAPSP